jgi:hypothetical protein
VHEYRFATIIWMDEAITALAVEPQLDDSRFLTQLFQNPASLPRVAYRSEF